MTALHELWGETWVPRIDLDDRIRDTHARLLALEKDQLRVVYQPQVASWDKTKVVLLSEFGNWVGIDRVEIVDVTAETQQRGFGTVIDTTTISLGIAAVALLKRRAAPARQPVTVG